MKKAILLIIVLIVCSYISASAADVFDLKPATCTEFKTGTKSGDAIDGITCGGYFAFNGVNVSADVKSVLITAGVDGGGNSDGEIIQIRKGGLNGEVLGNCIVDITGGKSKQVTYKCGVNLTKGTYDLYFISIIGKGNAKIYDVKLSSDAYTEKYQPATNLIDTYSDTWTAVDALGRALPNNEAVGDVRENKFVGIFYWTWHESIGLSTPVYDVTKIIAKDPKAATDIKNPGWGPTNAYHFWTEPLFGYYRPSDEWVIRKHAQMLSAAGVDALFFDCTNGDFTWRNAYLPMLRSLANARKDGLKTPQVVFILNFGASETTRNMLTNLYLSMYQREEFYDLWFKYDGKPLILAYPASLKPTGDAYTDSLYDEIKNFFTFRLPQPGYIEGPQNNNQWGWLEMYPQNEYGKRADGCEQVTVGVAQNHNVETRSLSEMSNGPYISGRSYTYNYGFDYKPQAYLYGYNFREQWSRAFELDPDLVFVTGWNEWVAMRGEKNGGKERGHVDQYNSEYSRDCEPVVGDLADNYYYQLTYNIRKFKGVRPTPVASAPKTITSLNDWADVEPSFISEKGTTFHRDADGYIGTHYTNNTGRNDIVLSKVARDNENLYFYVQTASDLTPSVGSAWMRLFINSDSVKVTGWEGYDYRVNEGALEKYNGAWQKVADVKYEISGNKLMLKIARAQIGVTGTVDIEFKWVDNMQSENVMDFWVNGDAAPCGRYNYRYTEKEGKALSAPLREKLKDVIIVKNGSSIAYVDGGRTAVVDADPRISVKEINGEVLVPVEFLQKALNLSKVEYNAQKNYVTVKMLDKTVRLTLNDFIARVDGRATAIPVPAQIIDGTVYLPLNIIKNCKSINGIYSTGDLTSALIDMLDFNR